MSDPYFTLSQKLLDIAKEASSKSALQIKKKGVGILAEHLSVPIVPVYIDGAFKALPMGKVVPKFNRIKVIFSKPLSVVQTREDRDRLGGKDIYETIAKQVQEEVSRLAATNQDCCC